MPSAKSTQARPSRTVLSIVRNFILFSSQRQDVVQNERSECSCPPSSGSDQIFIEGVVLSNEEKDSVIQEMRQFFPDMKRDQFVFDKTDLSPKTERVVKFVSDLAQQT
jgi:hypothetical protein